LGAVRGRKSKAKGRCSLVSGPKLVAADNLLIISRKLLIIN